MLALVLAALAAGGCAGRRVRASTESTTAKMQRGYDLLKQNRPEDAAAAFREVLRAEPAHRAARTELAYLELRFKHWQAAVDVLDSLVEEDPSDMRLRMEKGYARQALGELGPAADEFNLVAREPGEFQEPAQKALTELASESTPEAKAARAEALLNEGYDALRQGRDKAAQERFQQALLAEPGRTEIQKQLGYMNVAKGDLRTAARDFEGVHVLEPDDYEAALQLGYLYDSLHDDAGAEKAFTAALRSPDREIGEAAAVGLKNIEEARQPLYLDVYAAPFYTSRFSDKVAFFEGNLGYKPEPRGALSYYLATRYTQDQRSHAGAVPQIYSDNAFSFGPGIRIQPRHFNAALSVEWGPAWNLTESIDHRRAVEYDTRVLLADYHYWQGPLRTFADAGGSLGYYSRYRDNAIGYVQARAGLALFGRHAPALALYAPFNAVKDTNHDFFNNLTEWGGGAEFQPWPRLSLKLRVEVLRGTYTGIVGRDPNPFGRHYDDIRVTLLYFSHFVARSDDDNGLYQPHSPRFRW